MSMLIKTYLAKSGIHGIGLFSEDDIPAGTQVWSINPRLDLFVSDTIAKNYFSDLEREYLSTYCVKEGSGWRIIGDNTRFINHSRTPNIAPRDEIDYAIRDIKKDEEITYDYRNFKDDTVTKENWI